MHISSPIQHRSLQKTGCILTGRRPSRRITVSPFEIDDALCLLSKWFRSEYDSTRRDCTSSGKRLPGAGDAVKKHMPDAPASWDKVTIYHLLTHTSGIPSFTGFSDYTSTEAIPSPVEKTVARCRDKPLEFEPGEKWNYSNSGYVLLGYLIEKISGKTYSQFVQENIFTPLGMKDSGYDSNSAIIERRASGYSPSPKGPVNVGFIHISIPFAARSLYSTTEGLLLWEQGLFGGKLLSAASLQKMITPFKSDYAFGLGVGAVAGRKVIDHGAGSRASILIWLTIPMTS